MKIGYKDQKLTAVIAFTKVRFRFKIAQTHHSYVREEEDFGRKRTRNEFTNYCVSLLKETVKNKNGEFTSESNCVSEKYVMFWNNYITKKNLSYTHIFGAL